MALSIRAKTAIVTGAGSGINLALSRLLLTRGCNVLFADLALRPEAQVTVNMHATAGRLGEGRAVFQRTDVAEWRQLERLFDIAQDEFGTGVDVVVPGAGVYEPVSWVYWGAGSSYHLR
jgi:3-hydroxybutyrate dehydrogenase